jgi:RimJ/RimL family protein N-acetyltransferase
MDGMSFSVREMNEGDVTLIANYWSQAGPDYLKGLGVDLSKLPSRDDFLRMLTHQLKLPLKLRQSYCTIWQENNQPIGHCNVNKLVFGLEAYMHLHLWCPERRHQGLGASLVRHSLKLFFGRLKLQDLYCEPYALNPAPNAVLAKVGFEFVKRYVTVPGTINFEQEVNRWHMAVGNSQRLFNSSAR